MYVGDILNGVAINLSKTIKIIRSSHPQRSHSRFATDLQPGLDYVSGNQLREFLRIQSWLNSIEKGMKSMN